MKKLFVIALIVISICNVKAYENEYFKMDVPDGFKEAETDKDTFKWTKDNSHENVVITLSKNNSTPKNNVELYTDKDIEEYKTYLEKGMNEQLATYNLTVEVKNVKKEKINNMYALSYEIYWPTKESLSYDIYQKGYSFTTNKYVYVYTFTSDKEITKSNTGFAKTIDSLTLLDDPIESKGILGFLDTSWKKVLFTSVICGIFGAIISFIKKSKN